MTSEHASRGRGGSRTGSGTKRIALAFPAAQGHLHAILRGVADYARQHGRWLLTTSVEEATLPIESLHGWNGHGVIAAVTSQQDVEEARRLARTGIPVVTYSGALPAPGVPRVSVDNAAIGRVAAEHLLARGFRRFGLYALADRAYAQDRAKAFLATVRAAGGLAGEYWGRCDRGSWRNEIEPLARWVAGLPKPAGIFAVNDFRARLVIDACQLRGIAVPFAVGVLGVDNNPVVCEFSDPPLSSVACNWRHVGFEAARLLDRLMQGKPVPRRDVRVSPQGVERRQSTDVMASDDPRVNRAIDYVREHMEGMFGVERLVEVAGISRRSLETAFHTALGCTPYRYLAEARIARARELLRLPDNLKTSEVARRCGFPDARRLGQVFRRVTGITPTVYRHEGDGARRE